jgi:hypothetical protein
MAFISRAIPQSREAQNSLADYLCCYLVGLLFGHAVMEPIVVLLEVLGA